MSSSNFPDWLYGRLEELGFDALVYTRYIMSVLKQSASAKDEQARDALPNPNRSTLFECLMSSDMEQDSVNVFVDDIIGKHAQWERHILEKRKQWNEKRVDSRRSSFTSNYDEAFPPLLQTAREGSANVKRSADSGKCEANGETVNFAREASMGPKDQAETLSVSRSSGATPSKRPKLLGGIAEPNSNRAPALSADRCSVASDDDDGGLFDEISRVVLAFNNAVPCSACVFPSLSKTGCYCEVGRILGLWNAHASEPSSLWDFGQRPFSYSFQDFLIGQQKSSTGTDCFPKAKSGAVDSFECLLLDGQNSQHRVSKPFISMEAYGPFVSTLPVPKVSKFAFNVKDWVSGKCPMSTYTSGNRQRNVTLSDSSLPYQERVGRCYEKTTQKGKRRQAKVRMDPSEIPITTATHFIPIRSDSLEKGYYPLLDTEPMANEMAPSQQDFEGNQLDGDYFVYHDSPEGENCDEQWPAISSALKRSLTVKFRRAKMDKFCQTDRLGPEGQTAVEAAARASDLPDVSQGKANYGKTGVELKEVLKKKISSCGSSSERQHDSRLSEALPRELWQYQDEKDDELLIRYVSNISLIAPLDSLAPSVGGK
uniref:CCDC43 PWI-like domain-containing protein n=1 Tax=Trichuris muris TaxID=70415 RepID=A0A5S6QHS9_TRIMR